MPVPVSNAVASPICIEGLVALDNVIPVEYIES